MVINIIYYVDLLARFCMCILACLLVCIEFYVLAMNVVTVPSLQASAVVQPPMLLQMVNRVALVEPLGQQ